MAQYNFMSLPDAALAAERVQGAQQNREINAFKMDQARSEAPMRAQRNELAIRQGEQSLRQGDQAYMMAGFEHFIKRSGLVGDQATYGAWVQQGMQQGLIDPGEFPEQYDPEMMRRLRGEATKKLQQFTTNLGGGRARDDMYTNGELTNQGPEYNALDYNAAKMPGASVQHLSVLSRALRAKDPSLSEHDATLKAQELIGQAKEKPRNEVEQKVWADALEAGFGDTAAADAALEAFREKFPSGGPPAPAPVADTPAPANALAPATDKVPTVGTREAYDALPKGARYRAPDGKVRVKGEDSSSAGKPAPTSIASPAPPTEPATRHPPSDPGVSESRSGPSDDNPQLESVLQEMESVVDGQGFFNLGGDKARQLALQLESFMNVGGSREQMQRAKYVFDRLMSTPKDSRGGQRPSIGSVARDVIGNALRGQ